MYPRRLSSQSSLKRQHETEEERWQGKKRTDDEGQQMLGAKRNEDRMTQIRNLSLFGDLCGTTVFFSNPFSNILYVNPLLKKITPVKAANLG